MLQPRAKRKRRRSSVNLTQPPASRCCNDRHVHASLPPYPNPIPIPRTLPIPQPPTLHPSYITLCVIQSSRSGRRGSLFRYRWTQALLTIFSIESLFIRTSFCSDLHPVHSLQQSLFRPVREQTPLQLRTLESLPLSVLSTGSCVQLDVYLSLWSEI